MTFINQSGWIYKLIDMGTQNITGSYDLTFMSLFIAIFAFGLAARLPIEVTVMLMMPLAIGIAVFTSTFIPFFIIMLMFLAIVFVKRFIL